MKRTLKSAKSRGGCARCKTRRIKCNEARPHCSQCTAASVACPGYATQLRWSSKHEVFPKQPKPSPTMQPSPSSTESGLDRAPYEVSAGQPETNDMTDMSASPEVNPGLDHDMLGFFDDIFDMSPPYVQDISWSMRPAGMFDDWNSVGSVPGFEVSPGSTGAHETQNEVPRNIDGWSRSGEAIRHARLGTHVSDSPTSRPRNPVAARQSPSTTLLGTFYRLSSPNQVPSFSENDLVNYFHSEVCQLLSVFDSEASPFQTIVAELGASSRAVNLAIQSMAIGHLANHYPYMAPLGISKRSQAWRCLQQDLAVYRRDRLALDKILMSILLLGSTSVWHPGPSQGPQYLLIARNIMQKHLQDRTALLHEDFFQNCLVYWEQTMSFVDPTVTMPSFPGFGAPALCKPVPSVPVHPHPWTGISPEVHFATAEVGRILRRRQRFRNGHPYQDSEVRWAESLEEYLFSLEFPTVDEISDFGDSNTSKTDLIRIAEAYRFFGLLELYNLYSQLLSKRLQGPASLATLGVASNPRMDEDSGEQACWLTHIALHMIETVKAIPISSGASRNQIAILVAVSSHLRLVDGENGSENGDRIISARYFVESSLLNMARKYAQRPAAQAIDVVKEVWARLDSGAAGEHWMTVAHENRWLSFLG